MSTHQLQDQKPIIIKKRTPHGQKQPKNANTEVKPRYQAGKNIQNKSSLDMRKIDNQEIQLPTASLEMRKLIQQTRSNKNWTQEDLAKNCDLRKETIRDYENGKAIVKKCELVKINRALGLNIKKPTPIPIGDDE